MAESMPGSAWLVKVRARALLDPLCVANLGGSATKSRGAIQERWTMTAIGAESVADRVTSTLTDAFARQRVAYFAHPVPTLAERRQDLRALQRLVRENRDALCDAVRIMAIDLDMRRCSLKYFPWSTASSTLSAICGAGVNPKDAPFIQRHFSAREIA
jgi:hypothetical protein